MSRKNISVIIPALNEEAFIKETLGAVKNLESVEIIVVDGGSSDKTNLIAKDMADTVIAAPRGRASQMNAGAREAKGDVLFFLHADCIPPVDFGSMIIETLQRPGTIAGAFDIRIGHTGAAYRLIERMANLRSHLTGVAYGDQGLFISRPAFEKLGGFGNIPLMEDIEIGKKLKQNGGIEFRSDHMTVSPRRWLNEGILRTTLIDWALALAYSVLGVPPEKLASYYRDAR